MKRLMTTTAALAILAAAGTASAENVIILQKFDVDTPQLVLNSLTGKTDVTGITGSATNVANVATFVDPSDDAFGAGLGDTHKFIQLFDDEQVGANLVASLWGDVGADLSVTNVANVAELTDSFGQNQYDHGDIAKFDQELSYTDQLGFNTMVSGASVDLSPANLTHRPHFDDIFLVSAHPGSIHDSSATVSNIGNVATLTDSEGGTWDMSKIKQAAYGTEQLGINLGVALGAHNVDMEVTNVVNVATLDLSNQNGDGFVGVFQRVEDASQVAVNTMLLTGSATNVSMAGTNVGNVVTFVVEDGN